MSIKLGKSAEIKFDGLSQADVNELSSPGWRQVLRDMEQISLRDELNRNLSQSELKRGLQETKKKQLEGDRLLKTNEKKEYFRLNREIKKAESDVEKEELTRSAELFSARMAEAAASKERRKEDSRGVWQVKTAGLKLKADIQKAEDEVQKGYLEHAKIAWEEKKQEKERVKAQQAQDSSVKREQFQRKVELKKALKQQEQSMELDDLHRSKEAWEDRQSDMKKQKERKVADQRVKSEQQKRQADLKKTILKSQQALEVDDLHRSKEAWEDRQQEKQMQKARKANDLNMLAEQRKRQADLKKAILNEQKSVETDVLRQSKEAWQDRQYQLNKQKQRNSEDRSLKSEQQKRQADLKKGLLQSQQSLEAEALNQSKEAWIARKEFAKTEKERRAEDQRLRTESTKRQAELKKALDEQEKQKDKERLEANRMRWVSTKEIAEKQKKKDNDLKNDARRVLIESKKLEKELKKQKEQVEHEEAAKDKRVWITAQDNIIHKSRIRKEDRLTRSISEKEFFNERRKRFKEESEQEKEMARQEHTKQLEKKKLMDEERRKKKLEEAEEKRKAFLKQKEFLAEERKKQMAQMQEDLRLRREESQREKAFLEQKKKERLAHAKKKSEFIRLAKGQPKPGVLLP